MKKRFSIEQNVAVLKLVAIPVGTTGPAEACIAKCSGETQLEIL